MTEFEGQIWIVQNNDEINFVCTIKRIKNKIQALNEKGRELRVSKDKLLWQHPTIVKEPNDWHHKLATIKVAVDAICKEIDIALLWETALELEVSAIDELIDLYFGDEITTERRAAVWYTLLKNRLYFKRKGKEWEARTAKQVQELTEQRERELLREKSQALAEEWLQQVSKNPMPAVLNSEEFKILEIPYEITPFIERLENWLRGSSDKELEELINKIAIKLAPRELAFEVLQKTGRLPLDADRDVIVAGLKTDFSAAINDAAKTIEIWQPEQGQNITDLLFSIDDEETREVDDALGIEKDGEQWKLTIAIAEPTSVIHRGDILDREAMRRGTTVYLPTQTVLMLPEHVSCNIASLTAEQVRSSLIIRVWLDEQGQITNSKISREAIKVLKRLHYVDADKLIATEKDDTGQQLRNLLSCAKQLQTQRQADGAFTLQRPEYKIKVNAGEVFVDIINKDSPSRLLVAEMMILANQIAAKYAYRHQIPLIYRTQDPPIEPITKKMASDPLALHKIRKLLGRSSLSLYPGSHSGLGLSMYTQLTSPLRRFADLVMQRQLMAHLLDEELPYDEDELLKVQETADRTTRAARQIEGESKKRWFMQYLKQSHSNEPLGALVVNVVKGGYKTELQPWGVEAYLATNRSLNSGQYVTTIAEKIRVKAGNVRLKLAK
ncbi:RNB domain-containing ribonuclease [Candidatus Halobeggiatoa sp. HSG11]|nr:RNB domain-containing ribonuclease [Candidatus Halobeggiatoa sp. HSG11]